MAKARCEWDALKFDPSTQKLHEFLDVLQKTAKEAFGSEAAVHRKGYIRQNARPCQEISKPRIPRRQTLQRHRTPPGKGNASQWEHQTR